MASRFAIQLSLTEIGLGSFLHAFHIPFSGFFLSLNQCFVLNRALLQPSSSRFLPMCISNSAAIIKTLSPYGKKITPMLAISIQGLLFNIGVILFGKNLLGRCVGSLLLSLWPLMQRVLIYGIIYGSIFQNMVAYYNQLPLFDNVPFQAILAGYIFIHIFVTVGVCLLTAFLPVRILDRYDQAIASYTYVKQPRAAKSAFLGVLKDFTRPLFLLSLILSGIFFYATLHSLESFLFTTFRLIAVAFVTFYLLRNISTEWCLRVFSRYDRLKKYTPFVEEVLQRIQTRRN